jgi:6-phosphofructokinase 1
MGRKAGFILAAARLADPGRTFPLQIYLAEAGHTLESLAENVNRQLAESGRCIVVVSEGFDVGDLGEAHDGFGHIEYGASRTAAAQVVAGYLNKQGLRARGQATWQVPGILQRSCAAYLSGVDVEEAHAVGRHAAQIAVRSGGGWMATIVRRPGPRYTADYDKIALDQVAHSFRPLPAHWISADGLDVTDDFIRYATPLLGGDSPPVELENGLPRFARLSEERLAPKLPPYIPIRHR